MNARRLIALSAPATFSAMRMAQGTAHMEGSHQNARGKDARVHLPVFGTNSTKRHSKGVDVRSLSNMSIISGSAHRALAEEIAHEIHLPLSKATLQRFADGEVSVQLMDNVRGQDVFIVQPCAAPVNDSIMELLLTVSCARRSGARRVIAVIPYFGYKHHRRGNPISTKHNSRFLWSGASDFAVMLEQLGVDHIIAVDMQRPGQGSEACFFDNQVPVETVVTTDLFIQNLIHKQKVKGPISIVAPNAECLKKAKKFQELLQKELKTPVKVVPFFSTDTSSEYALPSDLVVLDDSLSQVSGNEVIIVDDMVDTANTLQSLSEKIHLAGAKKIYVCAAHGLFSDKASEVVEKSHVTKIIVSNSLPLPTKGTRTDKIEQVSIAKYLADVIVTEHMQSYHRNKKEEEEKFEEDE